MGLLDRLQHAWNAFVANDEYVKGSPRYSYSEMGVSSSIRPDRLILNRGNEKSIVNAVFNRIALDCADVDLMHARLDENKRFVEEIKSSLNNCLTLEANKDQSAKQFVQDIVMSLLDEGVVAVVPIDTDIDPDKKGSYSIITMRVGKIVQWYPDHVQIEVYDDRSGLRKQIYMAKKDVAIIENPLYAVCNAPNSTLQRLIRKLNILDVIDEQSGSGKLDLIIQLPYIIKSEGRKAQAEQRKADLESQLANSKFGIAYTDGTEKITQLNRPVENNLMKQIEFLTSMLYSQLGITQSILDGTADEKTMLNYLNRTVKPIMNAIALEMKRKFLTLTARTQGQTIMYFSDPFKLIPVSNLADIADKFTRNEIMSSNEIRQIIGLRPIDNPQADELRNKNLNPTEGQTYVNTNENYNDYEDYEQYDEYGNPIYPNQSDYDEQY